MVRDDKKPDYMGKPQFYPKVVADIDMLVVVRYLR